MNKDLFFLQSIQYSTDKILSYINGFVFEEFLEDEKTIDAVERNLEIIGEAVKNLSEDFKRQYPHIPFKQIAGMRDKLIHDYFGTDYKVVWKTINDKIPELKMFIDNFLQNINFS